MADYLADFYPEWVDKEENPRQVILDLGKMITNRIPVKLGFQKLNKYDPEYWGLAMLLTDEQAEVALKMGVRKPKTMEDMVKLTGKTEAELEKILGDMSFMGILEYNWENPTRTKQWVLPMFVPGSAEFTNMNDTILKKYPEMGRFFERMSRLPLEKVTPMVPPGGAGIGMHVIPVEKAIETENQSISVEHISHWLDKYEGKYAASPCSCRKSRLTFDEGCADDPEGWCVAVGDMADYVVETGKGGRYITKEEALEIFRQGEENGFVHQITNIDGADKIFAICNCNINVCYALRTSQLFREPMLNSKEPAPSKERITLATVTNPMAIHNLLDITSLKTNNATREVATISKLLIKETFAALEDLMPNIRRMGAIMSRTTIAIV